MVGGYQDWGTPLGSPLQHKTCGSGQQQMRQLPSDSDSPLPIADFGKQDFLSLKRSLPERVVVCLVLSFDNSNAQNPRKLNE